MKKFFAIVLALVLTLGMTTVAFADNTVVDMSLESDFYLADAEGKIDWTSVGYRPIASGSTLYIPVDTKVETDNGIKSKNTVSSSHMRNFRISIVGGESNNLIDSVQWNVSEGTDYRSSLYIAVTTKPNTTKQTVEADFKIKVMVRDNADAYIDGASTEEIYEYTVYLLPSTGATAQKPATGNTTTTPSTPSNNNNTAATPAPTAGYTATVEDVQKAAAAAKQNGTARATIAVTNVNGISAASLKSLVDAAKQAGSALRIMADSTSEGGFLGRLYLEPSSSTVVTTDISYGVSTAAAAVERTKAMFEKHYNNTVAVVSLSQNGSYGFPVRIAVKADLTGLNTNALMFYSYDRTTGKYFAITDAAPTIDSMGFLHFNTALGGDIVITDKALTIK